MYSKIKNYTAMFMQSTFILCVYIYIYYIFSMYLTHTRIPTVRSLVRDYGGYEAKKKKKLKKKVKSLSPSSLLHPQQEL